MIEEQLVEQAGSVSRRDSSAGAQTEPCEIPQLGFDCSRPQSKCSGRWLDEGRHRPQQLFAAERLGEHRSGAERAGQAFLAVPVTNTKGTFLRVSAAARSSTGRPRKLASSKTASIEALSIRWRASSTVPADPTISAPASSNPATKSRATSGSSSMTRRRRPAKMSGL